MVNAQEWLDKNYPIEERKNVKELKISSKFLEGGLVIKDFVNLEELDCSRNQLTKLELNNLPKLKKFWGHTCQIASLIINNCPEIAFFTVAENLLESFDFTSLNPEKLTLTLSIRDNNFPKQNLSCFSKFVKLVQLYVGNLNEEKIKRGIYNRFCGSLETLKELDKLREINIGSTDIEKGLESLPSDLEWILCGNYLENAGCLKIREKLKDFLINEQHGGTCDYQAWRKANKKLIENNQKKMWQEKGFGEEEFKQWIAAGLKIDEYEFADYLRNKKSLNSQELVARRLEKLKEEYKELIAAKFSEEKISSFIQQYHQKSEQIPYEQFTNIEYLAEGGFGKVYKAEWKRKNVILKSLKNSCDISAEFLSEIAKHKLFKANQVVECYGISQDPEGNYVMVMELIKGGNLREYLQRNYNKLDFKKKLIQLHSIVEGLSSIHAKGLIHRDFHVGNILSSGSESFFADLPCYVTDLGLCRPASEKDEEGKVFGVLPYVAPEVLRGQPYTQKSDIYSFGMVTYGVISGYPPFSNQSYGTGLAVRICSGSRPSFQIKIPQLLEDLINRCWDADPEQRPSATELEETLKNWSEEVNENQATEFVQQVQEVEEFNKNLPDQIKFPNYKLHPGAIQHSKLINAKQITELLSSQLTSDESYDVLDSVESSQTLSFEEISFEEGKNKLKIEELLTKKQLIEQIKNWETKYNKVVAKLQIVEQERDSLRTQLAEKQQLDKSETFAWLEVPPKGKN